MADTTYNQILLTIEEAKISYLVAGGFAVNFHKIQRSTMDLDLIIHLKKNNVLKFVAVMKKLGLIPRVPVNPESFADEKCRREWIEEKNMKVFSFINPDNLLLVVDVFVYEPKPFEEMWQRRLLVDYASAKISVVGLNDLLDLKKAAGRDKDLLDIKLLEKMIEQDGKE